MLFWSFDGICTRRIRYFSMQSVILVVKGRLLSSGHQSFVTAKLGRMREIIRNADKVRKMRRCSQLKAVMSTMAQANGTAVIEEETIILQRSKQLPRRAKMIQTRCKLNQRQTSKPMQLPTRMSQMLPMAIKTRQKTSSILQIKHQLQGRNSSTNQGIIRRRPKSNQMQRMKRRQ